MRQTTRAVTSTRVENRSLCVYWRVAVSANSWLRSSGRRAYSRVPRSMTVRGLPLAKRSKIFPRSMPCLPVGGGVQGHPADRLLTLTPTFKGMGHETYTEGTPGEHVHVKGNRDGGRGSPPGRSRCAGGGGIPPGERRGQAANRHRLEGRKPAQGFSRRPAPRAGAFPDRDGS